FFSSILFTDEATFTNHGNLNLHNVYHLSVENPRWIQWVVNVWCRIVREQIIGPYFIDETLTDEKYEYFIRNTLGTLVQNVGETGVKSNIVNNLESIVHIIANF
ncbi:hypothetical protein WH47_08087, partial [Habropoda laboriosa]